MKKGHPRTGEDIIKHREENKRWYLKTAEVRRKKSLEWAQQNPEKKKAYLDAWNERNRERVKAYRKKRYEQNQENARKYSAEYKLKNQEKVKQYVKDHYLKNKERISAQAKLKRLENREAISVRAKIWREKNIQSLRKQARESMARRRKENMSFRIATSLRNRLRNMVMKRKAQKSGRTLALLGCDLEFFLKHIEDQFTEGMTWENYGKGAGKWSLDHKIPCSHFQLQDPEHQKKCFHFTNLQPLWDLDNIRKGNKVASDYRPAYFPVPCSA